MLLVLAWLYSAWNQTDNDSERRDLRPFVFCGVVVGLIPFFNLFAFGVPLAFAGIWWVMTRFDARWVWFLVPAVVLALPMVRFLQPPSSSLEFPYDWVDRVSNPGGGPEGFGRVTQWVGFWFKNLGFFLPLLVAAQVWRGAMSKQLAWGLMPLWLFFIVPNVIKPHPWNGNNTHYFVFVLLIGALPIASLIVNAVRRVPAASLLAVPLFATLTLAGFLDVAATNGRVAQPYPTVAMNSGAVAVGEWARTTETDAVFVIEMGWEGGYQSVHQHPVPALSGRDVVVHSDGWVFDLGIPDWFTRKDHSRLILEAAPGWEQLVDLYDVDYLVVGAPTTGWQPNTAFWEATADVVYNNAGWTVFEL